MDFGRTSPCVLSRSISQLLYSPLYPSPQNQAARLSGPLPAFQVILALETFVNHTDITLGLFPWISHFKAFFYKVGKSFSEFSQYLAIFRSNLGICFAKIRQFLTKCRHLFSKFMHFLVRFGPFFNLLSPPFSCCFLVDESPHFF